MVARVDSVCCNLQRSELSLLPVCAACARLDQLPDNYQCVTQPEPKLVNYARLGLIMIQAQS